MKRHNVIPLGRLLGIPIGLDYSWFLIFAALTWSLAVSCFPAGFRHWPPMLYWEIGAITALMPFASVLLHELGHSVVAVRFKVPVQGLLAGHTVAQAMNSQYDAVPADLTLQQLVDEYVFGAGRRCFVVTPDDNAVGLMKLHRIRDVSHERWPVTTAGEMMMPLERLKRLSPDTGLWSALQLMDRAGVNQLPVMTDSRVVGMLTREDAITFLRTVRELGD